MIRLLALFLLSAGLTACGPEARDHPSTDIPIRIVSLDYCADQFVLRLVEPSRIAALSPDAGADYSYMRDTAHDLPTVRPTAEDALALEPDLIVRSYGGGPNAAAFFERAGVPVVNIGYAETIADMARVLREVGTGLDAQAKAEQVIADMEIRLDRLNHTADRGTALYLTPSGATTGPGSLVGEMLTRAGFANYEQRPGWRQLALERLATSEPDHVAAAFFDARLQYVGTWNAMRHPVARHNLSEIPTTYLDGAWTSCGAWFLLDAIEALAGAGSVASLAP
jgi:iron complex transport system substrate-binding protein